MGIYRDAARSKFQRENDATVAAHLELVERLRLGEGTSPDHLLLLEAADRIEQLEMLLREVYAAGVQIEKVLKG